MLPFLFAQSAGAACHNAAVHKNVCSGQEAQPLIQKKGKQSGDFLRLAVAFKGRVFFEYIRLPAFQRTHRRVKIAGRHAQATHIFLAKACGIGLGKPNHKMLADGVGKTGAGVLRGNACPRHQLFDEFFTVGARQPVRTLVLRIKALLRRARIVDEHRITIGDVELDYDTHTVRRGHDAQVLPPKEFNLLYKLLAYPERTFTRLELLDEIWGMDSESDDKTVNVHINRLRTRFYDWPEFEIQTIRGIGYRAIKKV